MDLIKRPGRKRWRFTATGKNAGGNLLPMKGSFVVLEDIKPKSAYDMDVVLAPHHGPALIWDQIELPEYKRKALADAEWVAERMRYAALTLRNLVEVDPDKRGGVPVLKGTRMTVAQLIAELAEDRSVSQIAAAYRLDKEQIKEVLESLSIYMDRPTSP